MLVGVRSRAWLALWMLRRWWTLPSSPDRPDRRAPWLLEPFARLLNARSFRRWTWGKCRRHVVTSMSTRVRAAVSLTSLAVSVVRAALRAVGTARGCHDALTRRFIRSRMFRVCRFFVGRFVACNGRCGGARRFRRIQWRRWTRSRLALHPRRRQRVRRSGCLAARCRQCLFLLRPVGHLLPAV